MPAHPITFGTDGWRGIISREVTFDSMGLFAGAVARVVSAGSRVLVGYDTRFLSPEYGELVAAILRDRGVDAVLASRPCPSPALSWAVAESGAAAGVMITASHNPPTYSGIKVKGDHGGPATPDMIEAIARACDELAGAGSAAWSSTPVPLFDPGQGYLEAVLAQIDGSGLGCMAGETVVVDAFHGSAAGYVSSLLEGTGIRVVEIRSDWNPGFGGMGPEPRRDTSGALGAAVKHHGAPVGIMFDGDGDRLALWDEGAGFLGPQLVFALLLDHLARGKGRVGSVVRTTAVTSLVDRLASRLGLPVIRRPVGFGHICREMLAGGVLMGGEEAGGFGFGDHIPDRDALLAAILVLEMMGIDGCTPGARLEALFSELGRLHFDRVDVHLKDVAGAQARVCTPPSAVAGLAVLSAGHDDGLHLQLENDSWLLIRSSGTEPLVRVYGEAPDTDLLSRIMSEGVGLVEGRWP